MTRIARINCAIPLIADAGETVVLATAPTGMIAAPGAQVAITRRGYATVSPADIEADLGPGPYDDFEDANSARMEGRFQLRPFRPEHLLRDLVDQLRALGVPDWHGAEGLSIDDAETFLASTQIDQMREARIHARALARVRWDEADVPFAEWRDDVQAGDTRVGYAEYVLRERERMASDANIDENMV